MPCSSSYMEPKDSEINSKITAQCLKYVLVSLGEKVPANVNKASEEYYGDPSILDEMVVSLCSLCNNMTEKEQDSIIYDGRIAKARRLADWWEIHQKADRERDSDAS